MNYQEALQKAAKLLRLKESSNPAEAALAASKAQEIIDRYQIESAALALANGEQIKEDIKDFGFDPLERLKRKASWKSRLASIVARHNGCKMYNNYNGPAVVGRPSDVATVRYIYAWLRQEVDRLAERDCKGNGTSWANNYRMGIVDTISERLHQQAQATKAAVRKEAEQLAESTGLNISLALMRIDSAIAKMEARKTEADSWAKEHMDLVRGRASYSRYEPSAREAGREAGREVRFTKAKASIR